MFNWAHTQIRLVLILTVSVCLIILAVGLTSFYTSKSVLQQELGELQQQMLRLNMDVIDEAIEETDQAAIQVALSDSVYWFLTAENQNSFKDISQAYQFLTTLVSNSAYIKSIYVYDIEKDSFLSIPQGFASNSATFVDSAWTEVAAEFGDKSMLVKKRELPRGASAHGSDITLFRQVKIQGEVQGIVAINLLDEALFSKLNPPVMNNLNRMRYIVDEQDQILYSVANHAFDEEAVKLALEEMEADGRGDMSYQNRQLLINQLESKIAGWRFISIVEQDSLLAQSKRIALVVFLVSIAALALGGAVIYYINAQALRPVRRLKQLFGAMDSKSGEDSRIDLEKMAGELLGKHAHLSHLVRDTLSEASSKLMLDLYNGRVSGKRDMEEKWQRYFPEWTSAPIMAAMLSIDRYGEWSRGLSGSDQSLLKFAIANIATELLGAQWRVACADFGKDKMALLLQPRSDGRQAQSKLQEVAQQIPLYLKFTVSVGVSHPFADVTRVKQALLEADNALMYRLYRGYGQVIPFHEVSQHEVVETGEEGLPIEPIIQAVEGGSADEALEAITAMMERIRGRNGYPSEALHGLQAAAARIDELATAEEQGGEAVHERFGTLHLADIEREFAERIKPVAARYGRLIESKDYVTCHRMIDYMRQHLGEPIGIPEISESAGISSSLASQVFKQETGETIYNYLTNLRMERAAELLARTDDRLSDIAQMVGYQHENSFIRTFRKCKDITPGKYRDMMRTRLDASSME
nr:helix-turn-helix domain-containing protein [Paenibacillus soyae]